MISTTTNVARRFDELADVVAERLALNRRVRRNLPGDGRLRIDRQLPFLCIYRQPVERADSGTRELVTTEASYLFASGEKQHHDGLTRLCRRVAETLGEHFGTFLFLEVWSEELNERRNEPHAWRPAFQIVSCEVETVPSLLDVFRRALADVQLRQWGADVEVAQRDVVAPPGLPPLYGCNGPSRFVHLGLAVHPVYRDPRTQDVYPIVLEKLRRQLAPAFRKTFAAFTGIRSRETPHHYQSYGPTALVRAAQIVDEQLCDVAGAFDFIYQVTPVNTESAWRHFAESGCGQPPHFWYRPLPYDPNLLKRRLFDIPIERIEDTTIAYLFAEKQEELDRQLTALRDIESANFLYGSIQLYGKPDTELVRLAEEILRVHPPGRAENQDARSLPSGKEADVAGEREGHRSPGMAGAMEVVAVAREEIAAYRRQFNGFEGRVEICDDIASGIMVLRERLLVAESVAIPWNRLRALLHHEIGTHLLTFVNGKSQPFGQLHTGLAGYEPLQEGLAVLSEYLAGGLTSARLRQLAGRVIAVDAMCGGAEFVETFRRLHRDHGFTGSLAFRTALRVYRGGGLTKDLVYLAGFRDLLLYLQKNHDLEPLFVGKIGLAHVPFIQELRRRNVILPPAVLPSLLEDESARHRLEEIRGASVFELCGVGK